MLILSVNTIRLPTAETRIKLFSTLNATMSGPRIEMKLTSDVVDILCTMDESYAQYRKLNGAMTVVLRKALYGSLQSAVLWY